MCFQNPQLASACNMVGPVGLCLCFRNPEKCIDFRPVGHDWLGVQNNGGMDVRAMERGPDSGPPLGESYPPIAKKLQTPHQKLQTPHPKMVATF